MDRAPGIELWHTPLVARPNCRRAPPRQQATDASAARTRTLSERSWPQAAMMSRPRGARMGAAKPASLRIRENRFIAPGGEHS